MYTEEVYNRMRYSIDAFRNMDYQQYCEWYKQKNAEAQELAAKRAADEAFRQQKEEEFKPIFQRAVAAHNKELSKPLPSGIHTK